MSIPELGQLTPVPLRDAWPHEAGSFTPWLAQRDNLRQLGEAVLWQNQHEWLYRRLLKFAKVFRLIVAELPR